MYAPRMVERLKQQPELRDVASDQQVDGLEARLDVDRVAASRYGVTPSSIDQALYDAYGQRQISTIFTQLNQYHVVLEVDPAFRSRPSDLAHLYVRTSTSGSGGAGVVSGGSAAAQAFGPSSVSAAALNAGATSTATALSSTASSGVFGAAPASAAVFPNQGQVPLAAFSSLETRTSPIAINHQGQFPVVTLSFNLAPGVSLGSAVAAVNRVAQDAGLPRSVQAEFQGTAQAFQSSLANEWILILAALITVYIVLGVLYESYVHPVTILSTLPSAGVGALVALMLTHNDFSVIALIGMVLLIGIVKKNAIMMIDFALEAERQGGMTPVEAIYQACLLRFRPIMMTTAAALLAGVPLALTTGTGSELRRPLGITIVGGLLVSQVLTLYTTPVIYLYFDRLARRIAGRSAAGPGVGRAPSE